MRRVAQLASRQNCVQPYTTCSVPRSTSFKTLGDNDITAIKSLVADPTAVVYDDLDALAKYNVDWLRQDSGQSRLAVRPSSTTEVASLVKYCNQVRLAVVPQGGNTGLVRGGTPVHDEIVISTERMNKIIDIDDASGVVQVEAGIVLEKMDKEISGHNLMVPLDLGSKGSCTLGGNVSTNAGGLRLLRYGNMHGNVVSLEVVLADGEVVECNKPLVKDNTGYHLKNVFIGSEGTLGIVTKVAIRCPTRPAAHQVALLSAQSFDDVLTTFRMAKRELGGLLSSAEVMDSVAVDCATTNLGLRNPLELEDWVGDSSRFYVLFEASGHSDEYISDRLMAFTQRVSDANICHNGLMTESETQRKAVWALRERLAEAFRVDGHGYKFDVSLPVPAMFASVDAVRQRLTGIPQVIRVGAYGHLGDGDVHINVTSAKFEQAIHDALLPFLFDFVRQQGGSISGEHGIGMAYRDYLQYSKSGSAISTMRLLKNALDPKGILNPYKIFA